MKKITIESNTRAPTGVDIDAIRDAETEKDRQEQLQQQKQRSSSSCPAVVCACTMIDGEKNVICTDETKPMDEIPIDVPGDTVKLDASGNKLVSVSFESKIFPHILVAYTYFRSTKLTLLGSIF